MTVDKSKKYQNNNYYCKHSYLDDDDSYNPMENWESYGPAVRKDIGPGEVLQTQSLLGIDGNYFILECAGGLTIECPIKKERRFFELQGFSFDNKELAEWLQTPTAINYFREGQFQITTETDECDKLIGSLYSSFIDQSRAKLLLEVENPRNPFVANVIKRTNGGFDVMIGGIHAFLPGSLAAANKITDFDSYVGKDIPVMIEDYLKTSDTFVVSNKSYIKKILPEKVRGLSLEHYYEGTVTGFGYTKVGTKYGMFIEFDEIFTGLLHVSEMTMDTLDKFNSDEIEQGSVVTFYIKEITETNRIILSNRTEEDEPVATIVSFKDDCSNTVQEGRIVGVQYFGTFIKMRHKNVDFTGLLHYSKYPEDFVPEIGTIMPVYVSGVDSESEKIFLEAVNG